MNLVLFELHEIDAPLPRGDRRAQHVLQVLRREVGATFDAGVVNGPRGTATVSEISAESVRFLFAPLTGAPATPPIDLLVGLCRPQTARDVLRDATTLGVRTIQFLHTEKSDANYAQSSLWSSGEWRRHVLAGAEQAFDTFVPEVRPAVGFSAAVDAAAQAAIPGGAVVRLALDNYEASGALGDVAMPERGHAIVAIGPERGWSTAERDRLRARGFMLAHLGRRVLRTETAVIAALALVRSRLRQG